jgi:hypothetical protein
MDNRALLFDCHGNQSRLIQDIAAFDVANIDGWLNQKKCLRKN